MDPGRTPRSPAEPSKRPPQRPLRTTLRGKFHPPSESLAEGCCPRMVTLRNCRFHAQCDRTTGVPDNGNEWRKFRAVPRSYPLRSLVLLCLIGVETEGLLDFQGRAGIISIVRWNLRPVIFGVDRRTREEASEEVVFNFWGVTLAMQAGIAT